MSGLGCRRCELGKRDTSIVRKMALKTPEGTAMQLEDYFDFLSPDNIRIKGHRIGVDHVLEYFLQGYTSEEIAATYPDLDLEKIYATITYYLHNRAEMDAYLLRLRQWQAERYQESLQNPSPMALKMRAIKAQRQIEQNVAS
jgi:uncharacterized protein (DUF433 family)